MTTRQKADFEKSLIDALKSENVANAICDAIIKTISKKFSERFNYYNAKIKSLEANLELLKSTDNNRNNINIASEEQKQLEQKVDTTTNKKK